MKHTFKIIFILLSLFLITQFLGLVVINSYSDRQITVNNQTSGEKINITQKQILPYGMQPPEQDEKASLISIITSFVLAITLILVFIKYRWRFVIKAWFFVVVVLALGITINAFLKGRFEYSSIIALLISLPLAYLKTYRPNYILHNFTEVLIYPGIATIFVPIVNIWTIIILLIIISIYDMWAVWRSKLMQKMAKFQMDELKIFSGLFIPYLTKNIRDKIARMKKSKRKNTKIKVPIAILGGGDIVFPIITAGVFLRSMGILPALFIVFGAFGGLLFLLLRSEKKKFYPAMPFITVGMFLGMLLSLLFI